MRRESVESSLNGLGETEMAASSGFEKKALLAALTRFKSGDFSVRLPFDETGVDGKIADTFNEVVELNERMAAELERLSQVVGKEGRIAQRASLGDVRGAWAASLESVNALIADLVHPTSETARVIGAVADAWLSKPFDIGRLCALLEARGRN